jgi:hypothetical protein
MPSNQPAALRVGDLTIHRLNKQEAPMLDARAFFPEPRR